MRLGIVLGIALAITIVAYVTSVMTTAIGDSGRPYIKLVNSCHAEDNGGTLTLDSNGFTPGSNYDTDVTLNGKFYFNSWGIADQDGHVSSWRWACDSNTKPGVYRVVVFDSIKQRLSNRLKFTVPGPPHTPTKTGSAA